MLPVALVVLSAERTIVSANRAFRRLVNSRNLVNLRGLVSNEELRQKTIEAVLPSDELIERIRSAHVHGDTEPFFLRTAESIYRIAIVPIRSWEDEMEAETLLMVEDVAGVPEPSAPAAPALMDPSTLPAVLWQADAATLTFQFVGGAVEDILGYPASDWLTTPQFFSLRIHPSDRDQVMALYQAVAATGGEANAEFRALNASGASLLCRESVRVSMSSAGKTVLAGVLCRIGERRQLETQSLIAGRMDALRALAARMAHDLNNPLMIVTGYGEEILAALPAQDPLRGEMREIVTATTRMTELAGQLLAFTRPSAKAPVRVSLDRIIPELRERLALLTGAEIGIRMTRPVAALADREQLTDAILALASSALENTREVSRLNVIFQTGSIGEQIEPATLKPGEYTRIEIHAAGVGQGAPAPGVFESFLPVKDLASGPAAARAYLSLRQWGGDVFFSSQADQGSVFVIYLPYAEPEPLPVVEPPSAKAEPAPTPTTAEEPHRETILLVEDEPGIRGLVRKILRRERYQVLEAGSGEEAMNVASSHGDAIDLLLTDMLLPGMSGRALAESLHAVNPALRVVYVSGYTDDETVRAGEFPPGAKFLQKPFTLGALTGKVREALDA